MYIISLVFFGFAVRKYKDKYIPAALSMMLWFLASAMLDRPTELLLQYTDILSAAEKVIFAVMTVLLLWLCVLRKKPLLIDWLPAVGTLLAAAIRIGWFVFFHHATSSVGTDVAAWYQQLEAAARWKDFILQGLLCAVAVWHIWWMSKPRFIR